MSKVQKIKDIIIANPKIALSKGTVAKYIPMEEISSNGRYVFGNQRRAYRGGAKFEDKDIIFARITPCLQNRKIAQFISDAKDVVYGSTEYFVFRAIENVSHSSYVFYLLKSDLVVETAINSMKGASGRQRAEIKPILDLEIGIPSYRNQCKIGEILSAYDNLIENNNRRIAILEEMAQKLYREWFVHFRFPGHEDVKMVESEMGLIPNGWQWQPLFDVADIQYGFAFKSKLFCDDSTLNPVVRIRDILGNRTQTYSPEKPNKRYLICAGDILIGMDGIFHMNQWSGGCAYLNQRVVKVVSKSISTLQLFYALKPVISHLEATISGTTVAHLSDADMKKIMVLVADDIIQMQANKLLQPWLQEKVILQQKNTNLRKTRDLLLPRLISGDIDVSELDIPIKEG